MSEPRQTFSRPITQQPSSGFNRPSSTNSPDRTADGDRYYAYPPVVQSDGTIQEWHKPTVGQILADLGLRLLERAVVGMAVYAAEELVYFFQKRRFMTNNPPNYRN